MLMTLFFKHIVNIHVVALVIEIVDYNNINKF